MLSFQERDLNKIKYDLLPKLAEEIRKLRSDNEYLLDKIIELEERLGESE